jgi:hypothetical protein
LDLLVKSKLKFHKLFQKTYGIIYERNSDVFIDFFKDLVSGRIQKSRELFFKRVCEPTGKIHAWLMLAPMLFVPRLKVSACKIRLMK